MSLKRKASSLTDLPTTASPITDTSDEPTLKSSPAELNLQKVCPPIRTTIAEVKHDLDSLGYSVVEGVEEEETKELHNLFWAYLIKNFGLDPHDPRTWNKDKTWPDQVHGIIKSYGVGQSEVLWRGRTHPKIVKLWSELFGIPAGRLITSFDGAGYYPKGGLLTPSPSKKSNWWLHKDQSPHRLAHECWQSILQLTDTTTQGSGGFVCVPGTHKLNLARYFPEEVKAASKTKNWFKIPSPGCKEINMKKAICLGVPPGKVVLWDSRLPHANCPPSDKTAERMVLYICMKPAKTATLAIHKKRAKYFLANRTTSHWPDKVSVNPDAKGFRSKNQVDPKEVLKKAAPFRFSVEKEPELAALQKSLISPFSSI